MIKVIEKGTYKLSITKVSNRILSLSGNRNYAWLHIGKIGEILVLLKTLPQTNYTVFVGPYQIYEVKDEPDFTDTVHLELYIGRGEWQGFLLTTGLPTVEDPKNRIIATKELIIKKDNPLASLYR